MDKTNDSKAYRQRLKTLILDTASLMFYKQGVKDVRMDDIARELSISKRTLYEIYDNKENLVMDVVKNHDREFTSRMEAIMTGSADTMQVIVEFYRLQMKAFGEANPAFFVDLHSYAAVMEYLDSRHVDNSKEAKRFIAAAISEGYFLTNLNYDIISKILDGSSKYIMDDNLYRKYGLTELFHNFIMVFLRGICTEKGLRRLDELMPNLKKIDEG